MSIIRVTRTAPETEHITREMNENASFRTVALIDGILIIERNANKSFQVNQVVILFAVVFEMKQSAN